MAYLQSIDFNNLTPSGSQPGVTIHKRPRRSNESTMTTASSSNQPSAFDFLNSAAKKRKLKVVPNDSFGSYGSQENKSSNTIDDNKLSSQPVCENMEVPEDRVQLLKMVKLKTKLVYAIFRSAQVI